MLTKNIINGIESGNPVYWKWEGFYRGYDLRAETAFHENGSTTSRSLHKCGYEKAKEITQEILKKYPEMDLSKSLNIQRTRATNDDCWA